MFDRIFEGPGMESFGAWRGSDRFSPDVDIFERNGKFVVQVDLPGLIKNDVQVDISEDSIIIDGERRYQHEDDQGGVYRSERGHGHFRREISLPEGAKLDTATANFKNGVLEVAVDAPQLSKSRRRIAIQEEESRPKPGQTAA